MNKQLYDAMMKNFTFNKKSRPDLAGIHIFTDDERLIYEATDSFVFARITEPKTCADMDVLMTAEGVHNAKMVYPDCDRLLEFPPSHETVIATNKTKLKQLAAIFKAKQAETISIHDDPNLNIELENNPLFFGKNLYKIFDLLAKAIIDRADYELKIQYRGPLQSYKITCELLGIELLIAPTKK